MVPDYSLVVTLSYAQYAFDEQPVADEVIYKRNKADLYLYLNNDVAYFIKGYWDERVNQSVKLIDHLMGRYFN